MTDPRAPIQLQAEIHCQSRLNEMLFIGPENWQFHYSQIAIVTCERYTHTNPCCLPRDPGEIEYTDESIR